MLIQHRVWELACEGLSIEEIATAIETRRPDIDVRARLKFLLQNLAFSDGLEIQNKEILKFCNNCPFLYIFNDCPVLTSWRLGGLDAFVNQFRVHARMLDSKIQVHQNL